MRIGANFYEGKCEFSVWSPFAESMMLKIDNEAPVKMEADKNNYWRLTKEVSAGSKYFYLINGNNQKPDPASYYQPDGVHGASEIIDHNSFKWTDRSWKGIPLKEMIIYELHTGTFSRNGNFKGIADKLDYLADLGINMIEIMPVAQFPGSRNWGYDGVYPFAVHNSYGTIDDFKDLINKCHKKNIGVILDVVYNHLGPEGNYTTQYGPYFTSWHKTEWGDALNFDNAYSDHVRNYFIESAVYWLKVFHIDALRLDAVHSIFDMSAKHFLQELKERVNEFAEEDGRERYLIAESDMNDIKIINDKNKGGYNLDAQWSDDFHHSVHSYLTGERNGYYEDFGKAADIAKALKDTFVYSGNYSSYRKRKHGSSVKEIDLQKFVICIQNHDQAGNRAQGERLSKLIEFEKVKLAAGLMLLSPYIPLIFMGEEYAEEAPFLYFVNHQDEKLVEAVRKGRLEEFKAFKWGDEIPDPQSEETFLKSKLNHHLKEKGKHNALFNFYKRLIEIRKKYSFSETKRDELNVDLLNDEKIIVMKQLNSYGNTISCFNLSDEKQVVEINSDETLNKIFDSSSRQWCGQGEISNNEINNNSKIELRRFGFTFYAKGEE